MPQSSFPYSSAAVYCGAAVGHRPQYSEAARMLGRSLAQAGITLVYGGGNIGLMKIVADSALEHGGTVHGVIPHHLADKEIAHPGLTVLEKVSDMRTRKARMEELAECYIVLPGGSGTLEEFFEIYTLQQLYEGVGPIILFNTCGYWDPLVALLRNSVAEGFLQEKFLNALIITDSVEEMYKELRQWRTPGPKF